MPAVWHRGRKGEKYFEKGVEEEPQRSGSKRCPLEASPQKSHREAWVRARGLTGDRAFGNLPGFQEPTHSHSAEPAPLA